VDPTKITAKSEKTSASAPSIFSMWLSYVVYVRRAVCNVNNKIYHQCTYLCTTVQILEMSLICMYSCIVYLVRYAIGLSVISLTMLTINISLSVCLYISIDKTYRLKTFKYLLFFREMGIYRQQSFPSG
jgi:hypothetical protein